MATISVEQKPYNGDTWGSGTDMVTFSMAVNGDPTTTEVKDFLRKANRERSSMSHDDHICSPYDCTARPFGSRWQRVCYSITDIAIVVTYLHHYAIDI